MAAQHTIQGLASQLAPRSASVATSVVAANLDPMLGSVLSSLDVSLDAELNRYRRNRRFSSFGRGLVEEDVFVDVESDPTFDMEPVKTALTMTLPPLPPNRKLTAIQASSLELSGIEHSGPDLPGSDRLALPASKQMSSQADPSQKDADELAGSQSSFFYGQTGREQTAHEQMAQIQFGHTQREQTLTAQPDSDTSETSISALIGPVTKSSKAETSCLQPLTPISDTPPPNSYLTSSKALLEMLEDQSIQSDVADPTDRLVRRKTVSLVAGATVAFLGLVGGLGASYFMSDPLVAQRLANGLQEGNEEAATRPKSFDPPGPDLSGAEFVDLEIDNLSSLQMPQTAPINLGELPPMPAIPSALAGPSPSPALEAALAPQASAQTGTQTSTPTLASSVVGTQSVVLPVGLTYYVTVPFTSERGLRQIRGTIGEAFVRQFSDGNRVQLAAFDNAQSAQQFIEELKGKNISAEVYGPTTE